MGMAATFNDKNNLVLDDDDVDDVDDGDNVVMDPSNRKGIIVLEEVGRNPLAVCNAKNASRCRILQDIIVAWLV